MQAMRDVLITSADGAPSQRHRLVASTDWDEVQHWCRQIYLPYDAKPAGPARQPNAVLDAMQIGQLTLSRFSYGVPVHLSGFDEGAGIGLVLTTLQGAVRHWSSGRTHADTGVGDSYLVDLSRAHYRLDADARHLQVNLTFRHDAMAALHQRWFGCPAEERMWARAYRFGGAQSSWMQLLGYVCRCITEMPDAVQHGPLGRHLEEMIGVHLLTQWRQQLDAPTSPTLHSLAPRHVMLAEQHIRDRAREAPTLSALASHAGVSVRTLNAAFREYRQCTPMQALRDARLAGVRADLLAARPGARVRDVAEAWGYAQLGIFAANYRRRFGESPSETLNRRA